MSVFIYNSLAHKKQELVPIKGKTINMYSCGVTVYDKCHIGHARSLFVFDVIRRYLKYRGFKVNFVRNITDIDDKIIHKANELKVTSDRVAKENIDSYYEDLKLLDIDAADIEPRATENIPDMIKHIQDLIKEGFAYEVEGDVYFNVRRFKRYGKLSGQSIEKMMEAVRIDPISRKKDPLDFALWKKSKKEEPAWDSPWGKGRPGWHIECSVMSLKHLHCKTLDIHAGGRDLIFPHHENEIAQTEAVTKKPFAKYWIHHGLLTINGQKMAKSLGNYITIKEAVDRYSIDDLKMFFLSSHYASPIDFSEERIAEAHKAVQRFLILLQRSSYIKTTCTEKPGLRVEFIERNKENFMAAMDDDFNTPKALGCLFDLASDTNKFIDAGQPEGHYAETIYLAGAVLKELVTEIFGLSLSSSAGDFSSSETMTTIGKLLNERQRARANKDFQRSDEIRDILRQKGIIVEDTKSGQTWRWA